MLLQVDLTRAQDIHSNDPGAIKQMIDALTGDLLADLAPVLLGAGENIFRGLGLIVIVWTGLRIALSGGAFSGWDLVRLVTALAIPRTILTFYANPMPGLGTTIPEGIVGMGAWIADMVAQDAFSSAWEWAGDFFVRVYNEWVSMGGEVGVFLILDVFGNVLDTLAAIIVAVLAGAMGLISLLLLIIGYAQVIWAQFAIGIAVVVGPVFVPFLLIDSLAFLFWGWLRTLVTYSLYSAVAACVFRVFFGAVQAASDGLWNNLTPDLEALGAAVMWFVSYFVLALAGILAAFKIPELASALVSGSVSGGGMLGALFSVVTVGKASATGASRALRGGR